VDHQDADAFAARWVAAFRAAFPARTGAAVFVAPTAPPLTRLF
jgi:hypothetical protein